MWVDCINHCRVFYCYIQKFQYGFVHVWLLLLLQVLSSLTPSRWLYFLSRSFCWSTKLKILEVLRCLAITIVAVGFVFGLQFCFATSFRYGVNLNFLSGLQFKYSILSIISYYDSPLNWLFGLGPGHTIGRLGWLIPDYIKYLQPLGVTSTSCRGIFLLWTTTHLPIKTGSSMFALTFSWAGVWEFRF